jgi:hypothetical protein
MSVAGQRPDAPFEPCTGVQQLDHLLCPSTRTEVEAVSLISIPLVVLEPSVLSVVLRRGQ